MDVSKGERGKDKCNRITDLNKCGKKMGTNLKFRKDLRLFSNLNSLLSDTFPKALFIVNTYNLLPYLFLQ